MPAGGYRNATDEVTVDAVGGYRPARAVAQQRKFVTAEEAVGGKRHQPSGISPGVQTPMSTTQQVGDKPVRYHRSGRYNDGRAEMPEVDYPSQSGENNNARKTAAGGRCERDQQAAGSASTSELLHEDAVPQAMTASLSPLYHGNAHILMIPRRVQTARESREQRARPSARRMMPSFPATRMGFLLVVSRRSLDVDVSCPLPRSNDEQAQPSHQNSAGRAAQQ